MAREGPAWSGTVDCRESLYTGLRGSTKKPQVAEKFGPPNWLVQESWRRNSKGEPTEPFEEAAERVRKRYFPNVLSKVDVEAPDVEDDLSKDELDGAKRCGGCFKYFTHAGTRCYACQKKSERGQAQGG